MKCSQGAQWLEVFNIWLHVFGNLFLGVPIGVTDEPLCLFWQGLKRVSVHPGCPLHWCCFFLPAVGFASSWFCQLLPVNSPTRSSVHEPYPYSESQLFVLTHAPMQCTLVPSGMDMASLISTLDRAAGLAALSPPALW